MAVIARFFVAHVTEFAVGNKRVTLQAVSRGPENKEWAKYTPSGTIEMTINNPDAANAFEPGKDYVVTFEKLDDVERLTPHQE